jgi:pyruvate/2-oxoacid:ferredoxin oxidoreductase alpha subunit
MRKQLMKGNEAIVKSAILAGCRAFYGYPITPASEIAETAAQYMAQTGGVFLQAESEVAAINMLYGAASAGVRSMTASSGPGISLMQEGISYMAGAELPCVIADITRGGPGLGNIAAEQSDYHQVVKGGGHGSYRTIVLAPDSVQEMADLTALAFELADRYRNPVVGYGIMGRILKAVAAEARAGGLSVGVLRPITLYPFPKLHFQRLAASARVFVVVEMSNGQMLEDVRLALNGARPVEFLNRVGGNVPSHEEVLRFVRKQALRYLPVEQEERRTVHA